uniref:Adaptor related protein complex 1 subunit mu 3 n=1 Tax=Hucho hucho TaxID=62062 RepID=A0A4W5MTE4_9TELE
MSASAIFILDLKGKVLISRNYMGNMDMNEVDHFMPIMMRMEEDAESLPLVTHGSAHFLWIKHRNLYLVAMTKKNANAALVYSFLYKMVEVFKEYFKELEEESIRDNFVTVYELMDEVMDFGFPQTTDSKILQEYITQQGHKLDVGAPRPPATVTNAVSWRSEGIKYRKNEVFMDVIESVNLLVSATGSVLRSEIVGSIKLKVVLSGMPELRLGLNDKVLFEITGREKCKTVELEDVKFHQCVRLSRFENDRTISFIPPDGESELMSYRLNTTVSGTHTLTHTQTHTLSHTHTYACTHLLCPMLTFFLLSSPLFSVCQVKPLIWIESVIEKFSHSRVEIKVKARSQFKSRSTANNVAIMVPVPSDADSPKFKTSTGSCKYLPEKSVVQWNIKSFPGGKEYMMRAHFGLPSVESTELEGRRPITVNFEIPYFTVSGIQVRYLKIIEKSGYEALPWVRYITQSGGETHTIRPGKGDLNDALLPLGSL